MNKGLSLERLRSFLEVVEAGGFARAAPRNAVRQSQMSRQVSELEEYFGGPSLLERRGRSVAPTAAGARLAVVVRELVRGLDEVASSGDDALLRYTLGAGDSVMHWWLVPRIGAIASLVPGAVASLISLASNDIVARIREARIDFGVVHATVETRGLATRPVGSLEYALFVPKRLRAAHRHADAAELVATLPIAIQESEPALNEPLEKVARPRAPNVALRCETFPQVCRAIRSGAFAGVLPTIAIVELPPREVEEVALSGIGRMRVRMNLVWHPRSTQRSPRLARIADALEARLGSKPPFDTRMFAIVDKRSL